MRTINDRILKLIRKSGGLNDERLVMVTQQGNIERMTLKGYTALNDPAILMTIHPYSPWEFVAGQTGHYTWGTMKDKRNVDGLFNHLNKAFVKKGLPIVVGEWGAGPSTERFSKWYYYNYLAQKMHQFGMADVWWDNGADHFDRDARAWRDETVKNIIVNAAQGIANSFVMTSDIFVNAKSAIKDMSFPVELNGNELMDITLGDKKLVQGTDYTVNQKKTSVTFSEPFLKTAVDQKKIGLQGILKFDFSAGADQPVNIVVCDQPVVDKKSLVLDPSVADIRIPVDFKAMKLAAVRLVDKATGQSIKEKRTSYVNLGDFVYDDNSVTLKSVLLRRIKADAVITLEFWPKGTSLDLDVKHVSGVLGDNPFLPSWEYIPDGEPRVFGDRVYLYGSHDTAGSTKFCDYKLKVWSAPLSDLNNWRDEGDSFHSRADEEHADDVPWSDNELYAPDVVEKGGKYYLYFFVVGAPGGVAVSDTPAGPFKLVSKIVAPPGSPADFGGRGSYADPGVLVDDDGSVYIYWGYKRSHMAQINPANMYEILPDTYKPDIIPNTPPFNFFEAASMRKIGGTYYFIYADGGILVYATSKSPKGPFAYGGRIITNGRDYPGGNIHGSLCNLNGQWYIFYHRMSNNTVFSRRACAERVTIETDGSIREVEQTSLGFREKLDPYQETPADIACVLKGGNYITELDRGTHPVITNKNNCVIGYKYFDFGAQADGHVTEFSAQIRKGPGSGRIEIWIDATATGRKIGTLDLNLPAGDSWQNPSTKVENVSGRHALYLKFVGDDASEMIADLKSLTFTISGTTR